MSRNMDRRLAELEQASAVGGGVVAVRLYDDETREEAIAAHLASGGVDPSAAEITVSLQTFSPRPAPARD